MIKKDQFYCCNKKEQILMSINIISEHKIAEIVVLIYYKDKCLCPSCPRFPCCPWFPCGPCDPCYRPGDPDCGGCGCPNCCKCVGLNWRCCDENRCCLGLCPRCRCCDPKRCCCGLCKKPRCCYDNSCCCFPCPGCCTHDGKWCACPCPCTCSCCQCFLYCAKVLDKNNHLKYYVINNNKCVCSSKCLRRRAGLDFNICDVNKNPICSFSGRNNKNFGAFFEDSYSYEINFPSDADSDIKLALLNYIYALDTLYA